MAIETLRNEAKCGEFDIGHATALNMVTMTRQGPYIVCDHDNNVIYLKIQKGPIKENGINGCQVDDGIRLMKMIIEGLNKKLSCPHNDSALFCLDRALEYLEDRKNDREERGVEGESKA